MNSSTSFRITASFVLVLSALCVGAADLTVIDLHNRRADELIPVLRPLVAADVALSGADYKLLVRGNASEVERIREALAVLDRAPRQLKISVRYGSSPQSMTNDVGVVSNRGSQITVGGGSTISTTSDSSVSTVRVLEGNGAHIASGQSVPIVSILGVPTQSRQSVVAGVTTDYREITSGFDVLPRINGERVILDISTQQQRAADLNLGSTTVERATTTIAGRLGEWIELGSVTSSLAEQNTGVGIGGGTRRIATQSDQRSVAVKVELVD